MAKAVRKLFWLSVGPEEPKNYACDQGRQDLMRE
jgi:hypothetical protein